MKKKLKVALCTAAAISVLSIPVSASAAGFDNYEVENIYFDGLFQDVSKDAWYKDSVKSAYQYGLVKGMSDSKFNPEGNITAAQGIAIAARIHSIYTTGSENFEQGTPWYQCYVDYAYENGIIATDNIGPNSELLRREFAGIFADALPPEALPQINRVDNGTIPDVNDPIYGEEIYELYRAGIVVGSDKQGNYNPDSTIKRSEVATIVMRMILPETRQHIELKHDYPYYAICDEVPDFGAMTNSFVYTKSEVSGKATYTYLLTDDNIYKTSDYGNALEACGFIYQRGFPRDGGFASVYEKGGISVTIGVSKHDYYIVEIGGLKEDSTKFSTPAELQAYLNKNMGFVETPMGKYFIDTEIQINKDSMYLYDWRIHSDMMSSGILFYNLKYSIEYTNEQKAETVEILRDYQQKVYELAAQNFPDKKLAGGFYTGYYKYPNLQVGYTSIQAFTWTNYSPNEILDVLGDGYYSSKITEFHWFSTYDDYVFE